MKKEFEYILQKYLPESKSEYTNNTVANCIRSSASKIVEEAAIDKSIYYYKGSSGNGRWVTVPWIGIFDNRITNSARKGFYIVYLFKADMSGVYLSLNQGWTYFEKNWKPDPLNKIKIVSNDFRKTLKSSLDDFQDGEIDLVGKYEITSSNSKLLKGYERGHICGKLYLKNEIPEDHELVNDLRNMIGVYRELVGTVRTIDDYENRVKKLLSQNTHHLDPNNRIEKDDEIEMEINSLEGIDKPKCPEEFKNQEEYKAYTEGRKKLRLHITKERNPKVIREAKENFKSRNSSLYCEICGFNFEIKYGEIGKDYIEGHHILPLSQITEEYNIIRPEEIALVCSNCHRILHRKKPWLKVEELKKLIN